MLDELRRVALFSSGVAELTRHQAEQIIRDLVKSGDVRRQQASGAARELMERSRQNRKELLRFVRGEIQNQIEGLGLATRRDLERLERRIARLESDRKKSSTKGGRVDKGSSSKPKKAGTRKTGAKSTAKSTATRSGPS